MKKILAIIIAAVMLLSMTSCEFINMKGEEVEINYDTAKMQENLDKLRNEDGIYVELLITSYESGEEPVMGTMAYGETANMFYFKGEESESYYDFSDDTKTVMYDKNEEGVWVRSEIVYEETGMTREQMQAQCELQASSIFTYLDMYEQFNGQKMKKSTVEIAGRTCDEFNVSVGVLGYGVSYIFAVDPETGMCLKWQISASAGMEGSASASFTCNKFESPYTIDLPTDYVNAEDLNEDEGNEGEENNSGNGSSGTQGGENNSGNDSSSTQGGNSSVNVGDVDFSAIMNGSGATDVVYGELDEATKQAIVEEAQKDGVDVSFGTDGSMTVVDTDGTTLVQKPDGTWVIRGENGEEGQVGGNWPDNEFTRLVPKPDFEIYAASADANVFTVAFTSVTLDQIKAYVEQIKAAGFTLNVDLTDENVMGYQMYTFYAENGSGYSVEITAAMGTTGMTVSKVD